MFNRCNVKASSYAPVHILEASFSSWGILLIKFNGIDYFTQFAKFILLVKSVFHYIRSLKLRDKCWKPKADFQSLIRPRSQSVRNGKS